MKLCSPHLHYFGSHSLGLLVLLQDPVEDSGPLVHLGQRLNPYDAESSLQLSEPVETQEGRNILHRPAARRHGEVFVFLPVVFLIHAGEALQAAVACVQGRLEVFVDHHLLRSGVQHAEEPGRGGSRRGAAGRSEAASSGHDGRTAARQSPEPITNFLKHRSQRLSHTQRLVLQPHERLFAR